MHSFPLPETFTAAFKLCWAMRVYIWQILRLPLLVKLASLIGLMYFFQESNPVRHTLFLIPALFLEGWLLAKIVRMVAYQESWLPQLTGNREEDMSYFNIRKRQILGASIAYVLIKMTITFIPMLVMEINETYGLTDGGEQVNHTAVSGMAAIILTFFAIGCVWLFPLTWLNIPVAANWPVKAYIRAFRTFRSSVRLFGLWLLCFAPVATFYILLASLFSMEMPDQLKSLLVMTLTVIGDSLTLILATTAVTIACIGGPEKLISKG